MLKNAAIHNILNAMKHFQAGDNYELAMSTLVAALKNLDANYAFTEALKFQNFREPFFFLLADEIMTAHPLTDHEWNRQAKKLVADEEWNPIIFEGRQVWAVYKQPIMLSPKPQQLPPKPDN